MAECGHCKDCKWWDRENGWPTRRWEGECQLAATESDNPLHGEALAVALDGESYIAKLQTAPDFGCVQWEAKPDAQG